MTGMCFFRCGLTPRKEGDHAASGNAGVLIAGPLPAMCVRDLNAPSASTEITRSRSARPTSASSPPVGKEQVTWSALIADWLDSRCWSQHQREFERLLRFRN